MQIQLTNEGGPQSCELRLIKPGDCYHLIKDSLLAAVNERRVYMRVDLTKVEDKSRYDEDEDEDEDELVKSKVEGAYAVNLHTGVIETQPEDTIVFPLSMTARVHAGVSKTEVTTRVRNFMARKTPKP